MSEINITPFVDVLLVLLVSFLISAPLLTLTLPIQLPEGKLEQRLPDYEESILAVVNKNLQIAIRDEVYSLESLSKSLTNNKTFWEQKLPVYLQMDEQVPYGMLMELMLLFKNAGFPQVGLVFKKDSR
ncbi:MAG TPA: biopolymer transporter ExbD [Deltaproteobacteria bacterium]|nr:biopolymer transporter ExbD [Candidatus Lambdaproteobacteria bacterium]HIB94572.1 biopolymer transporter ExbD [Candidatus Lambdaproteobacteria bacterium]HIN46824.1 biopolymer transporter ExbD [Deltaproteobacteria bacterium]HIO11523.1 biopolymer transporter ExbD [Deltaproteobacteria bacterium]HIO82664.1 biopolymer transporter ExbD [Deltaproteobacteria bacterium]